MDPGDLKIILQSFLKKTHTDTNDTHKKKHTALTRKRRAHGGLWQQAVIVDTSSTLSHSFTKVCLAHWHLWSVEVTGYVIAEAVGDVSS